MADPFTDHALRPTTSNATSLPSTHLRSQASQTSLRSGAGSAASNRPRAPRELFAPTHSRRAPSRAQRRVEDDILADSDSDRETVQQVPTNTRLRRMRRISPDQRQIKLKQKQQEEIDIVYRQPDGNFLRDVPGEAEALRVHLASQELKEEEQYDAVDDEYANIAKQYFVSGASLLTVGGRKVDEDFSDVQVTALAHLRNQVILKLEEEKWRFQSTPS